MEQFSLSFKYERKRSRTKEDRIKAIKEFWELLQGTDKEHPITQEKVSRKIGIGGEAIRDGVKFLRRNGFPISGAGKGYYLSYDEETAKELRRDLAKRSNSMKKTIKLNKENLKLTPTEPDWDLYERLIDEDLLGNQDI